MPFAAALSEHPEAIEATAEIIGEVLERVGPEPDLAVLFLTAAHLDHAGEIADTVYRLLQPRALVGASAVSIVGRDREVEGQPALSLWAGRFGAVEAVRLDAVRTGDGMQILGVKPEQLRAAAALVLLADPATFPVDDFVDLAAREFPDLTVIGGMASAGFGPGGNRLILDGTAYDDGAVAALIGPDDVMVTVVSQGCRPIGAPLVVTRAEHNIVHEIAGQPALTRLDDLFRVLSEDDRELLHQGLHVGRVIDERKLDFSRGDFLVRNVIGADRGTGSIAIGDVVDVGDTIQFHVRDADSADEDLRELLAGRSAEGALVFTCNGRGVQLFGRPDHDAELIDSLVEGHATAGMFCAGEVGPVGPRSFLHGFTASIALFCDPPTA